MDDLFEKLNAIFQNLLESLGINEESLGDSFSITYQFDSERDNPEMSTPLLNVLNNFSENSYSTT